MTSRLPIALAFVALVGGGLVSSGFAAKAQGAAPKAQAAPQEEQKPPLSAEDRAAFLDARIAALHAGLELTSDQEKLWSPVDSALRDFSKLVAEQRRKFRAEEHPLDPLKRLQMRSNNLIARGQALKKVADAAAPLYATLTEAQKRRLPILAHTVFHPFMHHRFAMMGGGMMGGGMMGRGMMGRGMMGGGKMGCGMMGGPSEDSDSK